MSDEDIEVAAIVCRVLIAVCVGVVVMGVVCR